MHTRMKLNDIPLELRTETTCISRMKHAIKTGTLEQMHEVLELIPKEILIAAYLRAHLNAYRNLPHSTGQKSLEDIPRQARTESVCLNAMKTAMIMDQRKGIENGTKVLAFIPKEMLITAFVRANLSEFT
jgi:hypothetical protein